MIRAFLFVAFLIFGLVIAGLSIAGLLGGAESANFLMVLLLAISAFAVLRRWAPARWPYILLHLGSAAILVWLGISGSGKLIPTLGAISHVAAAVVWVLAIRFAPAATIGLVSVSCAFGLFAIAFSWLCGPCFAVHALMAAQAVLILRRMRLAVADGRESPQRIGLLALSGAAAAGAVYIGLTLMPALTRHPDERAITRILLKQRPTGAVGIESFPRSQSATAGITVAGSGPATIEAFLTVGDGASTSALTALEQRARDGHTIVIHVLPGQAKDGDAIAVSWYGAMADHAADWATLTREACSGKMVTGGDRGPAAREHLTASGMRAAALGLRSLPSIILTESGSFTAIAHNPSPPPTGNP